MNNTILLVDDEPSILNTLSRLIKKNGYHVLTATSGEEAIQLLNNEKAQIIISDQRMPNMSGAELLAYTKKTYPDMIRMILSAYADFHAVKQAINEAGVYKFLVKPWDDESLLNDIREAFKNYEQQQKIKENELALTHLMYRDRLTGLYNRFSFGHHLSFAILNASQHNLKLALIVIEIDRFSEISNSLGFESADHLLQELVQRLSKLAPDQNNIFRLGSNRFGIIYSDFKKSSLIEKFLAEISKTLHHPISLNEKAFYLTVSMGVSIYPEDTDSADLLRQYANLALEQSKESGGNTYQFYQKTLHKPVAEQFMLVAELHEALLKHQFLVFYQPLVSIQTGKIVGAEALLRWQHPIHHLIRPDLFLPLCEKTGLIVDIGEWVLREVCKQITQWNMLGYKDLCIAVNLSQRQFNHPGLLNLIENILNESGISPNNLELEITESMMMQNVDHNIALLKSLRNLGLKLALDDFGTGYSSLSYLKQFPFNILKIDKSFIQDIATAKDSTIIVTAIITMAKSLGLTLIAEGVETEAQLAILKEKQCDIMQGFLFSKPIPEVEFTQLLKKSV